MEWPAWIKRQVQENVLLAFEGIKIERIWLDEQRWRAWCHYILWKQILQTVLLGVY